MAAAEKGPGNEVEIPSITTIATFSRGVDDSGEVIDLTNTEEQNKSFLDIASTAFDSIKQNYLLWNAMSYVNRNPLIQHAINIKLQKTIITTVLLMLLLKKFKVPNMRIPHCRYNALPLETVYLYNNYMQHINEFKNNYFVGEASLLEAKESYKIYRQRMMNVASHLIEPLEQKYIENAKVVYYYNPLTDNRDKILTLGISLTWYKLACNLLKELNKTTDPHTKEDIIIKAKALEDEIKKQIPHAHSVIKERINYLLSQSKESPLHQELKINKELRMIKNTLLYIRYYAQEIQAYIENSSENYLSFLEKLYNIEQKIKKFVPSFFDCMKNREFVLNYNF